MVLFIKRNHSLERVGQLRKSEARLEDGPGPSSRAGMTGLWIFILP